MIMRIDLNVDIGEGIGNESMLMPFISSANIACGYHAGDEAEMERVIELCVSHGVAIGAHPSFADRPNFGRKEISISESAMIDLVTEQLFKLNEIVTRCGSQLHHVKPHGALYNMAARDAALAATLVRAVKTFNCRLVIYGLAGSVLIGKAAELELPFAEEAFADRRYTVDGALVPRSDPAALITDPAEAVQQVLDIVRKRRLVTVNGEKLPVSARTVCIHGDGSRAITLAKAINTGLTQSGIFVRRPA